MLRPVMYETQDTLSHQDKENGGGQIWFGTRTSSEQLTCL